MHNTEGKGTYVASDVLLLDACTTDTKYIVASYIYGYD